MNSRQKGKRGELALVHKLNEYGYKTRRSQQFAGINNDADVVGLPFLHVECKVVERLNIHDAMAQSKRDARESEIPVVMHKKNYSEWLCTLRLDDFMPIYAEWEAGRESEDKTNDR